MPKHEKGTPKEIANRIKSKGLQKLRWFCQACQKQCRDENGFKCHITSEAHQRQLLIVAEDPGQVTRQFSKEFEANFMQILRIGYGTRRVRANEVYQEVVKDKMHVHMNSTIWYTLGGFVQYLGNTKKCLVDKNEKGWYITYIDPEEELRKAQEAKRKKSEKDDASRDAQLIEEKIQRGLEQSIGEIVEYQPSALIRNDEEKISLQLNLNKKPTLEELNKPSTSLNSGSVFEKPKVKKEEVDSDEERRKRRRSRSRSRSRTRREKNRESDTNRRSRSRSRDRSDHNRDRIRKDEQPKKSALEDIRDMEERKKERINRKDHWMREGIVVKIVTKKLGPSYVKAKGVVVKMIDDYTATVELDDGKYVKVDQTHVETVIPSVGRQMIVVNGAYRGVIVDLESLDEKSFSLNCRIASGPLAGRQITVAYEDASKKA